MKGFDALSNAITEATGSPWATGLALLSIVVWTAAGFVVGFSDTHQLIINTGTTIVTFLMVFLIQASQNRSDAAMQTKLDELIRAQRGAHNDVVDAESQDKTSIERKKRRAKGGQ